MTTLLKSKLREKLLVYFFSHPGIEQYVRELAVNIKIDPTNLSRELMRLEKESLFVSEYKGKQKYYKLNDKFPLLDEYRSIIAKTVGVEFRLKDVFAKIEGVDFCFIYGSYASRRDKADSDIDLLMIGEGIKMDPVLTELNKLEKEIGREINYRIFSKLDLKKAIKEKNSFILNITKKEKIFLIGNEKDFRKFN